MNLRLKKCDTNALDELVEISRTTFIKAFEKDNDPIDFKKYIEISFAPKKIQSELLNPDMQFYFVYLNDDLVAYFKLNQNSAQTDVKLSEAMELERIYVREEFHGHKIGRWMIEQIKKIAFEQAKDFLWLGVWEKNTRAVSFYENNGFTKFGMHPYYIGSDKQMDWMMRFELTKFSPT